MVLGVAMLEKDGWSFVKSESGSVRLNSPVPVPERSDDRGLCILLWGGLVFAALVELGGGAPQPTVWGRSGEGNTTAPGWVGGG